jgi:hypothetical protein
MNTETQQCIIDIRYNGDLKTLSITFNDGKMWGCTGKLAMQIFKKLNNG